MGKKMHDVIYRRKNCRGCASLDLELVFSLRPSPIGDAYVTYEKINEVQPSYPIDLYMCQNCGLAQLMDVIDPDILYGEYIYITASSPDLSAHFQHYADSVIDCCKLKLSSLVVDIGSNDGTLLRHFKQRGMNVLGIEPATDIAAQATVAGIMSIDEFFTPNLAKQVINEYGYAKLITANNVFANIDDLVSWVNSINILMADDGVFIFESYYLADLLQNMVFDFIYHEHLSAFSVRPMQALFQRLNLELFAVERVATKGGSLRYFVQRSGGPFIKDGTVLKMLAFEENIGLYNKKIFIDFNNSINNLKNETKKFLAKVKHEGMTVAGFGASVTGTTLIYHFEIGGYLDYLVDDNTSKHNRFSPGLHLPVFPSSVLSERQPDYVIILAWRFAEIIISKNQEYLEGGGKFLIPVPAFRVVT